MAARRLTRGRSAVAALPNGAWSAPRNDTALVWRVNHRHLSASERERIAYLSGDQDCDVFAAALSLENFSGGAAYIDEVRAQFLSEDWMQGPLDDLADYVTRMRKGDKRDELQKILDNIRSVRDEAVQSMEYAEEQLSLLETEVNNLT